jgi:hypothetical protein
MVYRFIGYINVKNSEGGDVLAGGRPLTDGSIYWSMDTDFFKDDPVTFLLQDGGCDAVCLYLYFCNRCFSNSFFVVIDDVEIMYAQRCFGFTEGKIKTLLESCFKWKFFDKELFTMTRILTSVTIQTKYQQVFANRGRTRNVEVFDFYWLLDSKNTESFIKLCPLDYFLEYNIDYFRNNYSFIKNNYNLISNKKNRNKLNNIEMNSAPLNSSFIDDEEDEEFGDTPTTFVLRRPDSSDKKDIVTEEYELNIDEGESETNEAGLTAEEYFEIIKQAKDKYNPYTQKDEYYTEICKLQNMKLKEKSGYK